MSGTREANSEAFRLHRDPWGRLVFEHGDGRQLIGVVPARAFPISDPDRWISICDADGHEVFCCATLGDLPAEARQIVVEELARREFIPVIQRIESATTQEPSQWRVHTDRGPNTFQVNSEDDVRRLDAHRASVVDSHGIRYLIPDTRKLDAASWQILEQFL
ncbi:MAG: DUF1854 domain-containing protein [Thermoguttaceae bacterium]|jgi:hypothetical protein